MLNSHSAPDNLANNSTTNPEISLLIKCILPSGPGTNFDYSRIQWPRFLQLATQHRLIPLTRKYLLSLPKAIIPDNVITELDQKFLANTARNSFLLTEMLAILKHLHDSGINAIPFKGCVTAIMAYRDISMRQFDDIDILVPGESILKAGSTMTAKGYNPLIEMSDRVRKLHVNAGWGLSLKSPDNSYHLELLSNIVPDINSFQLPPDLMWNKTVTLKLDGHDINVLPTETTLILLCVHGAKHLWERLAWIADIAYLVRSTPDINWNLTLQTASDSGSLRTLLTGLNLVQKLADTELPENIKNIISNDPSVNKLTEKAITCCLRPDPDFSTKEEFFFFLQSRERASDKLHFILAYLFSPGYGDWQTLPLPESLSPLYWITRPFRLIGIMTRNLWKIILTRPKMLKCE